MRPACSSRAGLSGGGGGSVATCGRMHARRRGETSVTCVPSPGTLWMSIRPPSSSMRRRSVERVRPVPKRPWPKFDSRVEADAGVGDGDLDAVGIGLGERHARGAGAGVVADVVEQFADHVEEQDAELLGLGIGGGIGVDLDGEVVLLPHPAGEPLQHLGQAAPVEDAAD